MSQTSPDDTRTAAKEGKHYFFQIFLQKKKKVPLLVHETPPLVVANSPAELCYVLFSNFLSDYSVSA